MNQAPRILCKIASYTVQGTGAVLLTGCTVSNTFLQQVDQHLISPWRNCHYVMTDLNHFFLPEDLCQFGSELKRGAGKFALYSISGFTEPQK